MRQQQATVVIGRVIVIAMVTALAGWAGPQSVAAQDKDRIVIALNEYQDSGVSGTSTITGTSEGIQVSMELVGDALRGGHPTHIHTGTCEDFDPNPTYPLTTVNLDEVSDEGVSDTAIDTVSLDALLADDHVILVHLSPRELLTYFVCGDIKQSNAATTANEPGVTALDDPADVGEETGAERGMHMPQTGVGLVADDGGTIRLFELALLAVGAVVVLGAVLLRRRAQN